MFSALAENDIGARKYFYPLTNTFDCFYSKYDVNKTRTALHISKRVLTLPLYADLALKDVDRICDIILKTVKKNSKKIFTRSDNQRLIKL